MARYFFETRDGANVGDDIGTEYSSIDEARAEAVRCIAEMAGEVLPRGKGKVVAVIVSDENKKLLFELRLTLEESKSR